MKTPNNAALNASEIAATILRQVILSADCGEREMPESELRVYGTPFDVVSDMIDELLDAGYVGTTFCVRNGKTEAALVVTPEGRRHWCDGVAVAIRIAA